MFIHHEIRKLWSFYWVYTLQCYTRYLTRMRVSPRSGATRSTTSGCFDYFHIYYRRKLTTYTYSYWLDFLNIFVPKLLFYTYSFSICIVLFLSLPLSFHSIFSAIFVGIVCVSKCMLLFYHPNSCPFSFQLHLFELWCWLHPIHRA